MSVVGVDNGESSRNFAGNSEIDVNDDYVQAFLTDERED